MTDDTTTDDTISPPANHDLPLRIGVMRAPDASPDPTVAEMEARVVRSELERRIGPVTLDLRTDGPATGPWLPRELAAWPADVDATVELGDLGDRAGHLVTLFGRTIDPDAADVRSRMLRHLGVLPVDAPLTDDLLGELLPAPARPTDLWLVVRSAPDLATGDASHRLLGNEADGSDAAPIDQWFDTTVAALPGDTTPTITRLLADVGELRSRLDAAQNDLVRSEREALDRIEHLTAERDSLRERLDRAQLDATGGSTS